MTVVNPAGSDWALAAGSCPTTKEPRSPKHKPTRSQAISNIIANLHQELRKNDDHVSYSIIITSTMLNAGPFPAPERQFLRVFPTVDCAKLRRLYRRSQQGCFKRDPMLAKSTQRPGFRTLRDEISLLECLTGTGALALVKLTFLPLLKL